MLFEMTMTAFMGTHRHVFVLHLLSLLPSVDDDGEHQDQANTDTCRDAFPIHTTSG
jgi:hypothetical protein